MENNNFTLLNSYLGMRYGKVYNIFGEMVYQFTMNDKQVERKIDLSNHAKGVYLIQLMDDRKSVTTKKIIVE